MLWVDGFIVEKSSSRGKQAPIEAKPSQECIDYKYGFIFMDVYDVGTKETHPEYFL